MKKKLLAAAMFTFMAGAANAGTIQFTDTVDLMATDFTNEQMVFNLFDDLGGTRVLTGVNFNLVGSVSGTAKVENMSAGSGAEIDALVSSIVTLSSLTGQSLVSVLPSVLREFSATQYDGVFDYLGTSGATFTDMAAQKVNNQSYTEQSFLDLFTGVGTISTNLGATATSRVSGGGSSASSFVTLAGATATVTYTFAEVTPDPVDPPVASVPVPATALLLGSALFGFGMRKRKAK